jgi:hypothetical protein
MRTLRRLIAVTVAALLTIAICGTLMSRLSSSLTFGGARHSVTFDAAHLEEIRRRYGIEGEFDYYSRVVSFRRREGLGRKRMTKLPQTLLDVEMTPADVAKLKNGGVLDAGSSEPLQVEVPVSGLASTARASQFIFGISTTFERLQSAPTEVIGDWKYWLTDGHGVSNGAKLFLSLYEASEAELQSARAVLLKAGIDAIVEGSEDRDMPVRYINLVPRLYRQVDSQETKWLVLCDDDTFFPSMHGLAERFGEFDHTKELYIGTLSEDVGAVERHGSQAFGGAGVFLSLPMAKRITDSIGSCASMEKVEEAGWQGDKLLRNCIYEHSNSRLVMLPELWQLDFRGDPSGFYEWGHKPLSLHHYRGGGWHEARPLQFSQIAYTCGEDCILQRFQTADHFIFSSYSVAYYPQGITFETSQAERTFEALWETSWNFDYTFGPQRPPLKESGQKISWEIQGSEVRPDGSVLQTYLRRKDNVRWTTPGKQQRGDRDSVIELVWVPTS